METLSQFVVFEPQTIAEALEARAREPNSRYLAGGTDLITNLRRGLQRHDALIDLRGIPELRAFTLDGSGLRIGAAVTLADLVRNERIRFEYPALVAAAQSVAAPAHRESGTVGGNLCLDTRCVYYNESTWWREANDFCLKYEGTKCHIARTGTRCWAAYSGDLAPALFAYGAQVDVAGLRGTYRIPLENLFADDGAAHLTLAPDELIIAVQVPSNPWPAVYEKIRMRGAIDFPLAGVAVARNGSQARVGITGTDSRPITIEIGSRAEDVDHLCALAGEAITPMRTTADSPFYRRNVALALVRKLAEALA